MGERSRANRSASAVMPALLSADPSAPDFGDTLNGIFSKHPEAITNPQIAKILEFKQRLSRAPQFTADDITDPEHLAKYHEREAMGMDWRQNKQHYLMDAAEKKKREAYSGDLLGMGMHPDDLAKLRDKNGNIPDEAYYRNKFELSQNPKLKRMTVEDIEDPDLADKWLAREKEGKPWQENKQMYNRDVVAKQRREDMLSIGIPQEVVDATSDKNGYISSEDYLKAKVNHLRGAKQNLHPEEVAKLAQEKQLASRQATDKELAAYIADRYPDIKQPKWTNDMWNEAKAELNKHAQIYRDHVAGLLSAVLMRIRGRAGRRNS